MGKPMIKQEEAGIGRDSAIMSLNEQIKQILAQNDLISTEIALLRNQIKAMQSARKKHETPRYLSEEEFSWCKMNGYDARDFAEMKGMFKMFTGKDLTELELSGEVEPTTRAPKQDSVGHDHNNDSHRQRCKACRRIWISEQAAIKMQRETENVESNEA